MGDVLEIAWIIIKLWPLMQFENKKKYMSLLFHNNSLQHWNTSSQISAIKEIHIEKHYKINRLSINEW
jgi:hypothetical protein